MNWYKISSEKEIIEPEEVGYQEEWGEFHKPIEIERNYWGYEKGYPTSSPPLPLPKKLYHVTLAADKIMQEGFKTFSDPEKQTFGGHGSYVSLTDYQNAKSYAEGLKDFIRAANLPTNQLLDWLKNVFMPKWEIKESWNENIERFQQDKHRMREDQTFEQNIREIAGEALSIAHIYSKNRPGFPMFLNGRELIKRFQGLSPDQVKILEVETQPLEWHSGTNIWDDVDMSNNYTTNIHENEWRIWNPQMIKNINIVS